MENPAVSATGAPVSTPSGETMEQTISMYDVKERQAKDIPLAQITKITYRKGNNVRYGLRGNLGDRTLTKFVSKDTYDSLNVPEEPEKVTR